MKYTVLPFIESQHEPAKRQVTRWCCVTSLTNNAPFTEGQNHWSVDRYVNTFNRPSVEENQENWTMELRRNAPRSVFSEIDQTVISMMRF